MKNIDRWRFFMKDMNSPDTFINMSFYWLIGAALQRRVWVGSEDMPLFPTNYYILVGPPAVGKGLVIKQINKLLRFHKIATKHLTLTAADILASKLSDVAATQEDQMIDPMFPTAPENTTFAALAYLLENAQLCHERVVTLPTGQSKKQAYIYRNLSFCLEELSSLLQKNTDAITDFLLPAYDCGDYDKATKTGTSEKIRRPSLNLLAGTSPTFMQTVFTDRLIGDGFTSRTVFIYEFANRRNKFMLPHFSEEQQEARKHILVQIHHLAKLFGQVTYTKDAFECLRHYFEEELPRSRANYSPKLDPYYGRKNVHVQKLAMAVHFADKLDMTITLEEVQEALRLLGIVERRMHMALNFGRNPLDTIASHVLKYIEADLKEKLREPNAKARIGITKEVIWAAFSADLSERELEEVLNFLVKTGKAHVITADNGAPLYATLKA